MDTNTSRPKSPDWLRDFQAPESYSVPSSPSTSSAKSDVGKEGVGKSSGSSKGVALKENVHSPEVSGKASSRKQGSGKKEGTPRANAKRKEAGSKRVTSPSRKRKEVVQPSSDKIVILDDDDDGDGPMVGGLSRMSSGSAKRRPGVDSGKPPTVPKEKKSTAKTSLRQATLSSLFDARLLSQESENRVLDVEMADSQLDMEDSQQNVVASQPDVTASQSEVVGSRPDDPAIEEGATDLKNEEDVVVSQEPRVKAKVPSCLPLIFPEKVHLTKVLVECDGDSLDLSGDMGAVGRFSVSGKNTDELLVDLKGVIYRAGIVPSSTFMVVNIGPNEAKVEAVMNDFMQLRVDTDRHEDETMVEGTLDGFTLGSDDEGVRPSTQPPAQDDGSGSAPAESAKKAKKASQSRQKVTKKVVVKKAKVVKVAKASKAGSKVVAVKRSKASPKTTKKQAKK